MYIDWRCADSDGSAMEDAEMETNRFFFQLSSETFTIEKWIKL